MKTLFASLLTLCMASTAHAAYAPADVAYTVTGSSGDYTLDFTFKNQLIGSINAPSDWLFYHVGVSLPGSTIVQSPWTYFASSQVDLYNDVWTYASHVGAGHSNAALFPGEELGGFLVHSTELQPPSIASWFMTGSAQPDNGRPGFHSGGMYTGGLAPGVRGNGRVATMHGIANGTIIESPRGLTPVPIPGAVVLFGSGLAALAGWQLKRKHQRLSAAV